MPTGSSATPSDAEVPAGMGQPLPGRRAAVGLIPSGARSPKVGQAMEGEDHPIGTKGIFDSRSYLLTETGWIPISEFTAEVYDTALQAAGKSATRRRWTSGPRSTASRLETFWPEASSSRRLGGVAQSWTPRTSTTVRLGITPGERAWPTAEPPAAGDFTSARVDPGKGAFVYAANGEELHKQSATPYLIDARGTANTLDGPVTVARLGLTTESGPIVPATWLRLLPGGAPLSTELALCPPNTEDVVKEDLCEPLE